jgi:hypothetical protein
LSTAPTSHLHFWFLNEQILALLSILFLSCSPESKRIRIELHIIYIMYVLNVDTRTDPTAWTWLNSG